MIVHVANTFRTNNEVDRDRFYRAQRTWRMLAAASYGEMASVYREQYGDGTGGFGGFRDGKTTGVSEKAVPFVKDVINSAADADIGMQDVVMLTNADSCLARETLEIVGSLGGGGVGGSGVGYCSRRDVDKPMRGWLTVEDIRFRGTKHVGVDLIAMRWEAWKDWVEPAYPDMLLGFEAWDWLFKFLFGGSTKFGVDLVYHELHLNPYWYANRLRSKGNLYNRSLAKRWALEFGGGGDAGGSGYKQIVSEWRVLNEYVILPEHQNGPSK